MRGSSGILLLLIVLSGCASKGSGPMPGEDLNWTPGWRQIGQSVRRVASDPAVWGPLLAATALQLGGADERLSRHLREETPLFGSTARAQQASDDWRDATGVLWLGSLLLSPGPQAPADWLSLKGQLLLQQWLAAKTARGLTSGIKSLADRERPNGLNLRSFPSGHATTASAQAQLACYNLSRSGGVPAVSRDLCRAGQGAAMITAWARVEAGMHYPSDVLVGWALGRFVTTAAEAWMGDGETIPRVDLQALGDDWLLSLRWQF